MRSLAKLFAAFAPFSAKQERVWSIPEGRRVYAIGDVHGRLDLLVELCIKIAQDDASRAPMHTSFVFLGDLVDRGADSRGVIEFLMARAASGMDCVFLAGNHEEVFVLAAEGDPSAVARLHRMGGREAAMSYGVPPEEYEQAGFEEIAAQLKARVPPEHVAFIRAMREWHQIGDYVFVHAGIRPGLPMHEQTPRDLRWIRRDFLDYKGSHGAVVVHGHTVTEVVDIRHNRIAIDTGAYHSGKLTALGLEGSDRWLLTT